MKRAENFGRTVLKSSLLLNAILWLGIIISHNSNFKLLPYSILTLIPILIIWFLIMTFTIMPLFWAAKDDWTDVMIFKRYFPYYSIAAFLFYSGLIISENFESGFTTFSIVIYFTSIQNWIWLCKPKSLKPKIKQHIEKVKVS